MIPSPGLHWVGRVTPCAPSSAFARAVLCPPCSNWEIRPLPADWKCDRHRWEYHFLRGKCHNLRWECDVSIGGCDISVRGCDNYRWKRDISVRGCDNYRWKRDISVRECDNYRWKRDISIRECDNYRWKRDISVRECRIARGQNGTDKWLNHWESGIYPEIHTKCSKGALCSTPP